MRCGRIEGALASPGAYSCGMNNLVGASLTVLVVFGLAACGSTTDRQSSGIPGAQLAPVTTVSGVIRGEANQYGMLAFGWSAFDTPGGTETGITFAEPYYPVLFDSTGAFSVSLPADVTSPSPHPLSCPFNTGGRVTGGLTSLSEPAVGATASEETIRAAYRLESGDALAFFWYAPTTERVTCMNDERGNVSGGHPEDWDLRLVAGWNMVLAFLGSERNVMRTGNLPELEWTEVAP